MENGRIICDMELVSIIAILGICYIDGKIQYRGEWKTDMKNGFGTVCYSNGDKYVGLWKADTKNGKGICTYADNSTYDGEWVFDKKHGKGK